MEFRARSIWIQFRENIDKHISLFPLNIEDFFQSTMIRNRLRRVLDSIGEEMFPSGGAIPYSAQDVHLTDYLMNFLDRLPSKQANMITLLLLSYEHLVPLLYLRWGRFSSLSSEDRIFLLETLHDSRIYPLRMLNVALRLIVTFGYMADERVLKEMGYFKQYEYPGDKRLIEILKKLPWEEGES